MNKHRFYLLTKNPAQRHTIQYISIKCDLRKFLDILRKRMKTRDKRMSIAIASFPYKWRRSFHAIDDLPKPGDPAYDEQGVLRGYRSHGGAVEGGGQLGEGEGRDRNTRYDGFTVVREQSAHHRRSGMYKDDQKRSRVIMAYPRVKYIDVDVVLKNANRQN